MRATKPALLIAAIAGLATLAWLALRVPPPGVVGEAEGGPRPRPTLDLPIAGRTTPDLTSGGPDAPHARVRLMGSVVAAATGRAIPGARVAVAHQGFGAVATTDATGGWSLRLPPSRPAILSSSNCLLANPEFSITASGFVRLSRTFEVSAGVPDLTLRPFRLEVASARISGRITDAEGRDIVGATVRLDNHVSVTGEDGRYGPIPTAAGLSRLRIRAFGWRYLTREILVAPAPPVRDIRHDFCLASAPIVEAVVVDETGSPVAGAEVRAEIYAPPGAVTDTAGRFRWPLARTSARIWISREGHVRLARPPEIRVGTEARFVLPRGASVEGRILLADELPATERLVTAFPHRFAGVFTRTDAEGRFRLGPLPVGPAEIRVSARGAFQGSFPVAVRWPGPTTGAVLRLGGLLPLRFRIVDGATGRPVVGATATRLGRREPDPAMSDASGSLQFEVRGSAVASWIPALRFRHPRYEDARAPEPHDPAHEIRIVMERRPSPVDAPSPTDWLEVAAVDASGQLLADAFVVTGNGVYPADETGKIRFPPGDSWPTVLAAPDRERVILRNWSREAALRRPTLALRPAAPIRARVVDPSGRGVPDLEVRGPDRDRATTDAMGRFAIDGHAAGDVVCLRILDGRISERSVTAAWVVAGEPEVVLQHPGVGTIRVRRPEGDPAAWFVVKVMRTAQRDPESGHAWSIAGRIAAGVDSVRLETLAGPVRVVVSSKLRGLLAILDAVVAPDEETVMRAVLSPVGRLTGTVLDDEGAPATGATLVEAWTGLPVATVDADGRIVPKGGGVPRGTMRLVVRLGKSARHMTEPLDLSRGAECHMRLGLPGRVVVHAGGADPLRGPTTVRLRNESGPHGIPTSVDREGTAWIDDVPPGRRRIEIRFPGRMPIIREVSVAEGRVTALTVSRPDR